MERTVISVIIPCYNSALFIVETLESILNQTIIQSSLDLDCDKQEEKKEQSIADVDHIAGLTTVEVSIYDDNSSDETVSIILSFLPQFLKAGVSLVFSSFRHPEPIKFLPTDGDTEAFRNTVDALTRLHDTQTLFQFAHVEGSQGTPITSKRQCIEETRHFCPSLSVSCSGSESESNSPLSFSLPNLGITISASAKLKQCVGYARNRAVLQSSGTWLCMLDSDDLMLPKRLFIQLTAARAISHSQAESRVLVGGHFIRLPENATPRYTAFLNSLDSGSEVLRYRFRDLPLIQPTWFFSRDAFNAVPGGYLQRGRGNPEDLAFFYALLEHGGVVHTVTEPVTIYRYHEGNTSWSVTRQTMLSHRTIHLEKTLLGTIPLASPTALLLDEQEVLLQKRQPNKPHGITSNEVGEMTQNETTSSHESTRSKRKRNKNKQLQHEREREHESDGSVRQVVEAVDVNVLAPLAFSLSNNVETAKNVDYPALAPCSEDLNHVHCSSSPSLQCNDVITDRDNIFAADILNPSLSHSSPVPRELTIDGLHSDVVSFTRNGSFKWDDPLVKFGIWGNGRDGKQFFNKLSDAAKDRVQCFYDINPTKIGQTYLDPRSTKQHKIHIPIKHISDITAPFLVCVAMDQTDGSLEENIAKTGFVHGVDYFHVI